MSFIKLNQQKLNYQQQENQPDDAFILSDIVDSTISPEYPKIIRTTDELAIYFGTNWNQYDYYIQLLSSGISLLLYKPLLGNQEVDSYEIKVLDGFPDNPEEGILYSIGNDKYYIYNKDTDTFIDYDDLPENSGSPENSPSWKNRDTLGIPRNGYSNYTPSFDEEDQFIEEEYTFNFLEKSEVKQSIEDYGDLNDDVTFSFLLDFSNVDTKEWLNLEEDVYIVFIKAVNKINNRFDIFWVNNHYWDEVSIVDKLIPRTLLDNQAPLFYFQNYNKSQVLEDISQILSAELGYNTEIQGETIIIRSSKLFRVNSFSNIPGLIITPMESYSNQVITWGLQEENNSKEKPSYYRFSKSGNKIYYKYLPSKYLEFYSKLLGASLDPITITIKKTNNGIYQVIISKLNYTEFFYGRLDFTPVDGEIMNLESIINKNSKLVYCNIDKCYSIEDDSLIISDIPEGTWQLSGGTLETISSRNRWNGLKVLERVNVQEDFLLISDIQKWRYQGIGSSSYYLEYLSLLDYAVAKNCQILIQNNPIVQVKPLDSKKTTYFLGEKILNKDKGEINNNEIIKLSSQSIDYSNIKLASDKPLEISIDSNLLKDIKSSGLVFSGKDYNLSKVKVNDDVIIDSNIVISQDSNFSLESDNFSNLKIGDKITIETTQVSESTEGTLLTSSGKPLKSKEITGFKVGDILFNNNGNQLLEKVSEENQSVGVIKVNNNFYKVSSDNTVTEIDNLKSTDNLIELDEQPNKLIQLSKGYIVNSLGLTVSENTKDIDFSSEGNKLYRINDKIIDNSGKIISDKFQILSTKKESIPVIYSLAEKYYSAYLQEEINENEYALPWGNDFYFNYTGDFENRLIYFFKDFQIEGLYKRPGYYYFLKGILFNNWEIDKVIYDHDEEVEETDLGKQLQLKKSNYISLYNNSYHYKKFFWDTTGDQNYYCSGTLKYCQSRISRLFEKYKWKLLGFQKEGEIKSYVQNILNSVKEKNSSLIYSLNLEDLRINNNKAEVKLLLRTKEFIEKDIKLNVTLNYIY